MVSLRQMSYAGELRQLNERVHPFYGEAALGMIMRCAEAVFFWENIMTFQNNLTLISYQDQRYHLAAGANCQSACLSYLPDRGKSAARRVEMLRMQSPLPCGGKRFLGSRAADAGSGIDRTAR